MPADTNAQHGEKKSEKKSIKTRRKTLKWIETERAKQFSEGHIKSAL
jgi:hypothetical protein